MVFHLPRQHGPTSSSPNPQATSPSRQDSQGGWARHPERGMDLTRMAEILRDRSARAVDVIAGTGAIRSRNGLLVIDGTEPVLGPDGVTSTDGTYALTDTARAQLADKLGIPTPYLRKLADQAPELFDANVNGWLERTDKRYLIRAVTHPQQSLARAVLSDRYQRIDDLDVLTAVLTGIHRSGAQVEIDGCDLTEQRMHVRIYAPQVQALAPTLLARYRSPFDERPGSELPVVWAGFVLRNSEVGAGAFDLSPPA